MAAFGPPPGHPAAPSKNGQILSNLWGPPQLQDWVALPRERDWRVPINAHSFLELGVEVMLWSASLWLTVNFKARYGLNIMYLTFLPPLVFTLFRGMHFATLVLAGNAIIGTTLLGSPVGGGFSTADCQLLGDGSCAGISSRRRPTRQGAG